VAVLELLTIKIQQMNIESTDLQGCANSFTTEAIWSNHKTNYDAVQQSLQF